VEQTPSLQLDVTVGLTQMTCSDCGDRYKAWTDDPKELFDLCRDCADFHEAYFGAGDD
jgi:hypothetical protein